MESDPNIHSVNLLAAEIVKTDPTVHGATFSRAIFPNTSYHVQP